MITEQETQILTPAITSIFNYNFQFDSVERNDCSTLHFGFIDFFLSVLL